MSIKIFHTADIQVNIGGKHFRRKREYEFMLNKMSKHIIDDNYDAVVIVGDLFERALANETEKTTLVNCFIRPLLDSNINVIMVDGNHDLKQSNFSFDPGDGSIEDEVNVLKSLNTQIDHPNLHYFEHTGLYSITINDIDVIFAVWSHKSKYSSNNEPLNPWYKLSVENVDKQSEFNDLLSKSIVIDLFHDPVKNCINFDGQVVRGDNEHRIDIKEFKGDIALLGDIHMPSIMNIDDNRVATYPSSPIIRFFDEGDYYVNENLVQEGNTKHGFNSITIHDKNNIDIEFIQLSQYATKHTIKVDDNFDASNIETFELKNAAALNYINIVIQSFKSIATVDMLIKHLHSKYTCIISTKAPAQQITQSNLNESFNTDNLSNKEYLLDVARQCVKDKLESSKDVEEYKEQLIADVMIEFEQSLNEIDYNIDNTKFTFESMTLSNFMPIQHIEINFNDIAAIDSIVKINGNNGTGKTTIYKGISWLATGKIDWRQSDNKTKQNNLDYFNDKAYDVDEVYGELIIRNQLNQQIKICRKLVRHWSSKATLNNKKSKKWKEFIATIDETFDVYVDNVKQDDEQASFIMSQYFGDFTKFHALHIVNQSSLDSMLLNMNISQLIDFILKNIGFSAVEQLQNTDDAVKNRMFKNLTKHAKDINGINIDISIANQEIDNYKQQITENTAIIDSCNTEINALQSDKNTELSKQLFENAEIDHTQKSVIIDNISKKQQQLISVQTKIDSPDWTDANETELANLKSENAKCFNDIQNNSQLLANEVALLSTYKNDIAIAHKEIDKINLEFDNYVSKRKLDISTERHNIEKQIDNVKQNAIDKANSHIAELNKDKVDATNAANAKLQEILLAIQKIESLNESNNAKLIDLQQGECPVCKRSYADATDTQLQINSINEDIAANIDKINKLNSVAETLKTELSNIVLIQTVQTFDEAIEYIKSVNIDANSYDLSTLNAALTAINTEYANLANDLMPIEMSDRIKNIRSDISKLESEVESKNAEIEKLNLVKTELLNKSQSTIAQINDLENKKQSNDVASLYKLKDSINSEIANYQSTLDTINSKLIAIETNKSITLKVSAIDEKLSTLNASVNAANNNISKLNISIETQKSKITQLESIIDEIKEYEHKLNVHKLYKHLISKNGINKYVFDSIAMQINTELNNLLEELNFRIFFDLEDNYTIKMIDLLGNQSIRNLYTIGGMEGTLGSLSLLAIIKSKTSKSNGNFLFIDEISGKLNNSADTKGSETTNKDYQFEFFTILKKLSKHTNIAIIDHVLDKSWFPSVIEIVKFDNGISKIMK